MVASLTWKRGAKSVEKGAIWILPASASGRGWRMGVTLYWGQTGTAPRPGEKYGFPVLGSKTTWFPGAVRGGRRYGTPNWRSPSSLITQSSGDIRMAIATPHTRESI